MVRLRFYVSVTCTLTHTLPWPGCELASAGLNVHKSCRDSDTTLVSQRAGIETGVSGVGMWRK